MNRLERDLEQMFVDVAMVEGNDFSSPGDALHEAAETWECSFVDVAFAEAGAFSESACLHDHP